MVTYYNRSSENVHLSFYTMTMIENISMEIHNNFVKYM